MREGVTASREGVREAGTGLGMKAAFRGTSRHGFQKEHADAPVTRGPTRGLSGLLPFVWGLFLSLLL